MLPIRGCYPKYCRCSAAWSRKWRAAQDVDDIVQGILLSVQAVRQRKAVELLKLQGLSLDEASAATGKSVTSLKVIIHRALKTMRKALEEKR